MKYRGLFLMLAVFQLFMSFRSDAQTDTVRVMAYNVLNYGAYPLCQGPNGLYHDYLKQIVQYVNPDIIGLEKMGSVPTSPSDMNTVAPAGFGDSVLQFALNAAYPNRYARCPFTNTAHADNLSMLFYDTQKLGFIGISCSYVYITDFNLYKLYYKDPNLATTHDTTFLYVNLNHDQSGSESIRDTQILKNMQLIKQHFGRLPNFINMGDFNTHSSNEGCYQTLVNPTDTNFQFYDPPFYPDAHLSYPINWDNSPNLCPAYLTTSTRSSGTIPNSCGTSGGAKSWYDHIFLSSWIVNGENYVSYVPNSYKAIGNDGNRVGKSVNDNSPANNSAPANVINALFQMSNKYPVTVDLLMHSNTTGVSPADPEWTTGIQTVIDEQQIQIVNPVGDHLKILCNANLFNKTIIIQCADMSGRIVDNFHTTINVDKIKLPFDHPSGVYLIHITDEKGKKLYDGKVMKK